MKCANCKKTQRIKLRASKLNLARNRLAPFRNRNRFNIGFLCSINTTSVNVITDLVDSVSCNAERPLLILVFVHIFVHVFYTSHRIISCSLDTNAIRWVGVCASDGEVDLIFVCDENGRQNQIFSIDGEKASTTDLASGFARSTSRTRRRQMHLIFTATAYVQENYPRQQLILRCSPSAIYRCCLICCTAFRK